jgi:hypothetical protein
LRNNDTEFTTPGTDEIPGSATALQSLIQSQFTCWAFLRSRGRWQRRLISIETQRAPSHQVGSLQSAYRSRVYESDPRELEGDRVVKLGKPNRATDLPFRLTSWIGPGRWGCQGFASPRKIGAPLTTPPARSRQTEIGGMAGSEFREVKKLNFSA